MNKMVEIPVTFNPTNASEKGYDVTTTESPTNAFTYYDGKIYGYEAGTGSITFISSDGLKKATCKVTVLQTIQSIELNGGEHFVYMTCGDTKKITSVIKPANAFDKTLKWSSEDPKVVSVDQNGNLTAKGVGASVVSVENPASGYKSSVHVYVNALKLDDAKITLSSNSLTYNGKPQKPKVTIKNGTKTLVEGVDYKLTYYDNVEVGDGAYVVIQGIGNYEGWRWAYFSIKKNSQSGTNPSAGTGTGTKPSGTEVKTTINRIFGKSRYETATKIVDKTKSLSNTKKLDAIIIATGLNYPDALAGSYLAKVKDAPILITSSTEESNTINYIRNNVSKNGTVYILGGTGAVSKNVENKVKASVGKVIRLGGKSRYETNLLILKSGGRLGKELIVVTGMNFPDALSASAAGLPILIVGDSLTREQNDFLMSNKFEVITIIGGPGAVSKRVEAALSRFANVKRISGNNRYETSANVASNYFNTAKSVILATGLNYPDALTGGPLAIKQGAPMILTSSNPKDYSYARAYAQKVKAKSFTVLGGPKLISDNAVLAIAK